MFLIVTGNVNPYEIVKIVEDNMQKKNFLEYQQPKMKKLKEPATVVHKMTEITGNVENAKVKVSLKTPLSAFKNIDPIELRLIVSLILNNNEVPKRSNKAY